MKNMKVEYFMTPDPIFIKDDATIQTAAQMMQENGCGFLPVGTPELVNGIITDRDLVIRAMSRGVGGHEKITNFITKEIYSCKEGDFLEDAAEKMRLNKVSRLLVKDKNGKVVGILSFGSIFREQASTEDIANTVKHIIPLGI